MNDEKAQATKTPDSAASGLSAGLGVADEIALLREQNAQQTALLLRVLKLLDDAAEPWRSGNEYKRNRYTTAAIEIRAAMTPNG